MEFYKIIVRLQKCAYKVVGERLQDKLVEWLAELGEEKAAGWLSKHWVSDKKRNWLNGHGEIGTVGNNNGMESSHRWYRWSIACGHQVNPRILPILFRHISGRN